MTKITHIDKIKNLAVFSNYARDKALEPFDRYNLLYGWNGSGKTALSRLFASLESGSHPDFPELEYQVTIDDKKLTQQAAVSAKVRVFNSDYVEKNVKIVDGHASPIYVLGEKSQEVLKEIEQDEVALNGVPGDDSKLGIIELRRRAQDGSAQITKQHNSAFTQIAGTISAAWGAAGAIRNYRRPDAKKTFAKLAEAKLLSEEELKNCTLTLSQAVEAGLEPLSVAEIVRGDTTRNLKEALSDLIDQSNSVLTTIVQKVAISRLVENQDISNWVERGLAVHSKHESNECEYCQQIVPSERIAALEKHFSDADRILKSNIDDLVAYVAQVKGTIDSIQPYDDAKLYKQFRSSYKESVATFQGARKNLSQSLDAMIQILKDKKSKTTESTTFTGELNGVALNDAVSGTNGVLKKHNAITANHEGEQTSARQKIENHYLSTILDEIKAKDARMLELSAELEILENGDPTIDEDIGITGLKQRIIDNRAKVSSAHKSCEQINEKLHALCGRNEISFVVKNDANGEAVGYAITRAGKIARNVSEGEKTAIAFTHFCINLTEQDFVLKKGIVVIDDPISSLDSALLFKVCAAIKRQMKNAGQLFIFTHNFEFFNHIKGWYMNDPQICGEKGKDKANHRFLMIKNAYDSSASKRVAMIDDLDPMLRDFESEYHYLFKKLFDFEKDNPEAVGTTLQAIYDYPTIARKLLECFLSFRVPVRGSFYVRTVALKKINKNISGEDIECVYNFVNSHSHLDTKNGLIQFDPTLTVSGPDAIKLTLKLIEQADEMHFKAMRKAANKT